MPIPIICKKISAAILFGLFSFNVFTGLSFAEDGISSPAVITFDKFCDKVIAYYPKLKMENARVEIAIAKKLQAVYGYLPKIKGFTSMTTSNDQVYVFGTLLKQRAFTQEDFSLSRLNNPSSRTNYDIGLYGEMPIFDSLQTVYKVRQGKHLAASARYDELFSSMEAILIAADAYIHTLAVDELLRIADEACRESDSDVKQAEELKNKGLVLGADFYAAKVAYGNLKSIRNELSFRRDGMYALINILMGEDPSKPIKLTDGLDDKGADGKALGEWINDAYRLRPDLLSIDEAIRAQEAELDRERARALPNISAFGDIRENTQNFNTGGGSFAVGLKGSVDIFDPEYFARVRIAKAALEKIKHEKDAAKDSVAKEITDEYSRFRSSRANLPVLRDMSDDSAQAVTLMAPLYREGRKSIADLMEMRRTYLQSSEGYYGAMAGAKLSRSRLLFLSGQLDRNRAKEAFSGEEGR